MTNIAHALNTAEGLLTIHMLLTTHFFLAPGPVPDTDTAHALDMVLSHNHVEYHSQDMHILHHPRPLVRQLFQDSQDRMAPMVILEEFTCLSTVERLILMVFQCRLVQLMEVSQEWGLVPHTALQCLWMLLHLIKGRA